MDVNDNAPYLNDRIAWTFIASRLAPTGISSFLSAHKKGDLEGRHLSYWPNCRPRPPGTPWISVSSHGPFGLIERLQPLFQR